MQRKTLQSIFRKLYQWLGHVEVVGLENIPQKGGFILAANHMSWLDAPLVFLSVPRDDLTGLAADKYKRFFITRWLVNTIDGIWLNREEADVHAIRAAKAHLINGGGLGIAPEGTRSHQGALMRAKTGVAYLADKANVMIIPYAISGTDTAFRTLFHLRKPHVRAQIGVPFCLDKVRRETREADLQRNTDEIMCRIAALLPPRYWGYYAGHPRLKELLAQQQNILVETA